MNRRLLWRCPALLLFRVVGMLPATTWSEHPGCDSLACALVMPRKRFDFVISNAAHSTTSLPRAG